MHFNGERVVPWAPEMKRRPDLLQAHIARYNWALDWASRVHVLDMGCGTGYGSFVLSFLAQHVRGVDHDAATVEFAARHFAAHNLTFELLDLEGGPIPAANLYVAFEVLEHLADPWALIEQVVQCVDCCGGVFLWSVPLNHPSPYHRHVFTYDQAAALIPGSALWYQNQEGLILPDRLYNPESVPGYVKHVLGVRT